MLNTASAWLDATLKASEGEAVTLYVGGEALSVTAVVSRRPAGWDIGNGVIQTWEMTDFLILASDLTIAGVEFVPEIGTAIVYTDERDVERRFEVCPADNNRHVEPADHLHSMLRVHTKEVRA